MKRFAKPFVKIATGLIYLSPILALAQYQVPGQLRLLVDTLTNYAIGIIIVISVLFIVYAAFVFLTSQGGPDTAKARSIIIYSMVAIGVALLARVLVRIAFEVFAPFGGGGLPI